MCSAVFRRVWLEQHGISWDSSQILKYPEVLTQRDCGNVSEKRGRVSVALALTPQVFVRSLFKIPAHIATLRPFCLLIGEDLPELEKRGTGRMDWEWEKRQNKALEGAGLIGSLSWRLCRAASWTYKESKNEREREIKQKGDAEPWRCKRDPGYGCGCCRGSRERGRDEEGNGVNTRSCFVIHSCRTFALTPLAFYSPALSSACPPFTPPTPISIAENF
ncbi:hypothetical protein QQF64_002194 [Cirrhinus molitorella]|uniref:Uncharacterized protein n=1 Tax=Cirrhinus molitorella TaxID=172907 RepID=A0ABR3MPG4_9TELE